MRLLLSGYQPWGNVLVNPSEHAARAAAEALGAEARAVSLPVDWAPAREQLLGALEEWQPDLCLAMGQAGIAHYRIEELGRKPRQYAEMLGAEALESVFPWGPLVGALEARGQRVERSRDAGQFLCEAALWLLLDHRARTGQPAWGGFLHIPSTAHAPLAETVAHVAAAVCAVREGM